MNPGSATATVKAAASCKGRFSLVIVFDLDDTLYPEAEYVLSGFSAVGAWLLEHQRVNGFTPAAEKRFRAGTRGNIFDLALRDLDRADLALLVPQLVEVYRAHKPSLRLHPDADWALGHFRSIARTGIITDGYLQVQRNKVEALDLAPRVDGIIYSDAFGRDHWKPSPTPYKKFVELLGCAHSECIYVADNPTKDFYAAGRLGWTTVQIIRPQGEYSAVQHAPGYEARHVITSLHHLANIPEIARAPMTSGASAK